MICALLFPSRAAPAYAAQGAAILPASHRDRDRDPLSRLVNATYSSGEVVSYTYDAAGNWLSEVACWGGASCTLITTTYGYDAANRLTSAGGITYTWDANGTLLNFGAVSLSYDAANRLTDFVEQLGPSAFYGEEYVYRCNGLSRDARGAIGCDSDLVSKTVNGVTTHYVLDLAGGMTQVLAETTGGQTTTYLYGNGRIAQYDGSDFDYFLGDALGSVRQLADSSADVTLARSYEPYGDVLASVGTGTTNYDFTGEWRDSSVGLLYLRARWLNTTTGTFQSKDTWRDYGRPLSLNGWSYVEGDPINHTDPTGHIVCPYGYDPETGACKPSPFAELLPPGLATIFNQPILTPQQAVRAGIVVCAFVIGKAVVDAVQRPATWSDIARLPEPQRTPVVIPLRPPATATDEPTYIYRRGHRAKDFQVNRVVDWETGLSFFDSPPQDRHFKFSVINLRAHGYVVRPDGNMPVTKLWTGETLLNSSGAPMVQPPGHVTVYHPNQLYWDQWHQADVANVGTQAVSNQALAIFNLREP